ncbi:hypothetical protein GcM1_161013 [Golovinomyces cichoracearum]|uniref:Uncharacterized protein n=1 Tax=Golovinomyces cichoracearum TaxID=62708 RepID=A0A420J906_9PEZI|nr:hypothetical protein GcM1_161013 [Golovinomyces cichoracearum]
MRPECSSKPLEIWEHRYLKDILYKNVNSNTRGLASNKSNLRCGEVENSSWRSQSNEREGSLESRPDYARKELQEEKEITFEQFSGEIYRNVENPNSQSMSVVSFEEIMGEEVVALDAFLNIGATRKRSRPMNI